MVACFHGSSIQEAMWEDGEDRNGLDPRVHSESQASLGYIVNYRLS